MNSSPDNTIPRVLNQTFHSVDERLSRMCEESDGKFHSGCTAVTAFLRVEDAEGKQSFVEGDPPMIGVDSPGSDSGDDSQKNTPGSRPEGTQNADANTKDQTSKKSINGTLRTALKSLSGNSRSGRSTPRSGSPPPSAQGNGMPVLDPPSGLRRVLYCANAGDARAVLCRSGKAIRLTYDHKGSDKQEAKRIMDAGGFVMSGRVNGVLAVTRSLGDSSMKDFVVGSPYTTETELTDEDEFLILACDGVSV
jgi:protein phosphatase PTC1